MISTLEIKKSPKVAILTAAFCVVGLAAGGFYLSWISTRDARKSTAEVEHSQKILSHIEHILSLLKDTETGGRGFMLTGKEDFLEPYQSSGLMLGQALNELDGLDADNPTVSASISSFRAAAMGEREFQAENIRTRREKGFEAARARVLTREGKKRMDRARAAAALLEENEEKILRLRFDKEAVTARWASIISVLGGGLSLSFLIGAGFLLLREMGLGEEASQRALISQTILSNLGDGVVVADENGKFLLWNPAAEKLVGLGATDAKVSEWSKVYGTFLPDQKTPCPSDELPLAKAIRGELTDNIELFVRNDKAPDGRWLNLSGRPLQDAKSRIFGGVVLIHDISEQKYSRKQLEESEERFRLLVAGVKDYAILLLDTQGKVASWNEGAERIKGYKAAEILGQPMSRFYPEEEVTRGHPQHLLEKARAEGRVEDEGWRIRKDGSRFWADVVLTAVKDPLGKIIGFTKITRDLTDRKKNMEELQSLNKDLEAFSYSVSHDLRAPLRGIAGFSQILLEDSAANLDEAGKENLNQVIASTKLMGTLIDDIIELSRVSRTEMRRETVDMGELAKSIINELQARTPSRRLEFAAPHRLQANGDARLLRIALVNLIGNAWKYTGKTANARIEIGASAGAKGERVLFVKDNGAGFDMAYSGKLFGAFQRLHSQAEFEGTGIGLAIVQRIIKRHGGRIWAESAVAKGATFYFTL